MALHKRLIYLQSFFCAIVAFMCQTKTKLNLFAWWMRWNFVFTHYQFFSFHSVRLDERDGERVCWLIARQHASYRTRATTPTTNLCMNEKLKLKLNSSNNSTSRTLRERERELRYNAVDKQTNNITTTTATTEKIDRTVRAVVRNVVFVLFGSLFFFITILCDTRFTAEVS